MRVNLEARAATAEQRRARTRERLLDAAETVVVEKGFDGASIEEFVAAAGVSRGTFYNYFPTTAALLHALNTRVAEDLDRTLDVLTAHIDDCATRLAATLHTVVASCMADPVRGWVAMQIAASRVPRQHTFEDRFAATFREGVASGRFRDLDMTAAYTIAFGSIRMTQRDILGGASLPAHAVQVVALILAAFGVPFDEAQQISRDEAAAAQKR
jgi:AcrR family transcriptional regulator